MTFSESISILLPAQSVNHRLVNVAVSSQVK